MRGRAQADARRATGCMWPIGRDLTLLAIKCRHGRSPVGTAVPNFVVLAGLVRQSKWMVTNVASRLRRAPKPRTFDPRKRSRAAQTDSPRARSRSERVTFRVRTSGLTARIHREVGNKRGIENPSSCRCCGWLSDGSSKGHLGPFRIAHPQVEFRIGRRAAPAATRAPAVECGQDTDHADEGEQHQCSRHVFVPLIGAAYDASTADGGRRSDPSWRPSSTREPPT